MPITPWNAGQTRPTWRVTWNNIDLTGATVTVRLQPPSGPARGGAGVVTVKIARDGVFQYQPSAADFDAAGVWTVQFKAVFGDGTVALSDPMNITVQAAI